MVSREKETFQGKRVTAMGLGRFGGQVAAIRYLVEQGAEVLVTDEANPETLQESLEKLQDLTQLRYHWGAHRHEDFSEADFVLVSPAVKPAHPCLMAAQKQGIPILTEMELFLRNCRARLIAITGTVGKSTTATMLIHLLSRAGEQVSVGGNLGGSLLPKVDQLDSEHFVVLELSSFQLHWLRANTPRFEIAILTSFYPHHQDWHLTFEAYRSCKQAMFSGQKSSDLAVFPEAVRTDSNWKSFAETVYFQAGSQKQTPAQFQDWPLHWQENAAAVMNVAEYLGISSSQAADYLADYRGLPHRLEHLGIFQGRKLINDSKSTSPWATAAGLCTVTGGVWLIVGGAINQDSPQELFTVLKMHPHLKGVCWMGPGGKLWQEEFESKNRSESVGDNWKSTLVDSMSAAFQWSWENSQAGETILMAPGCPSFNEFLHYEQRGEAFRKLAAEKQQVAE